MIKLASLLFSTLFFFQSANIHFGDVLQLREFIEHANLHQEKYGDSFLTFVSKHYGDLKESHKEQHQEEEKNHKHAPIHHDCASQSIQIDVLLDFYTITFKTNPFIDSKKTNFYYQDEFSTFEKQKIFQPPRLV
ncbi:MAG: hypothetical protein V3U80_02265 [Flavobacteriaceae bacterium]